MVEYIPLRFQDLFSPGSIFLQSILQVLYSPGSTQYLGFMAPGYLRSRYQDIQGPDSRISRVGAPWKYRIHASRYLGPSLQDNQGLDSRISRFRIFRVHAPWDIQGPGFRIFRVRAPGYQGYGLQDIQGKGLRISGASG